MNGTYNGMSLNEYRAAEEMKAQTVVCPTCKANPGYPCQSKNGNQKPDAHLPRLDAGRRAAMQKVE